MLNTELFNLFTATTYIRLSRCFHNVFIQATSHFYRFRPQSRFCGCLLLKITAHHYCLRTSRSIHVALECEVHVFNTRVHSDPNLPTWAPIGFS